MMVINLPQTTCTLKTGRAGMKAFRAVAARTRNAGGAPAEAGTAGRSSVDGSCCQNGLFNQPDCDGVSHPLDARYSPVRKGDVKGFIERLYFRLINGIEWLGTDLSLFTAQEMEVAIGHYQAQHRERRFYQQTDRSVMTHINQVSALYQGAYDCAGAFPDDEETALEFDLRLNHDWRCCKGEAMDLRVDEKMLMHWLTRYLGRTHRESERKLSEIKEVRCAMRRAGSDLLQ